MPERKLHAVDLQTGEVHEPEGECLACKEWARKYSGVLSQLGNLRADKEAEARGDALWGIAVTLFVEWQMATGHMRSAWTADRFWLCRPYLERDGFPTCRYAVWGIAAHPNTKQITPDYVERYDSFELCFRNRDVFERMANRGWALFGSQLPVPSFVETERESPAE